jgi:pectate lyase
MNKLFSIFFFYFIVLFQTNDLSAQEINDLQSIAFPTAEGYGKYSIGGRGGKVYIVTNLNDNGAGSFRAAATSKEKRIIVFEISGTIHLNTPIEIPGNVTIAGQTAPGDGICIADQPLRLKGDNIIIRYLRFRMGDKYQSLAGMVDGSGGDDALSGTRNKHLIVDHCSVSWSTDEVMSFYGGDSSTLQWNLISEPLNYSYHFEKGDVDWEQHGYGGIWGGTHLSAHHNLFAHCVSRNPRFNGARMGSSSEFVDFRNNVIYNWQKKSTYGGEAGTYNMVNNFYKPGPSTQQSARKIMLDPSKTDVLTYGQFYLAGNVIDGFLNENTFDKKTITLSNAEGVIVKTPFPSDLMKTETALSAYKSVLGGVGASHKRDTLDERIILDVKNNRGKIIDVQGGFPHGTKYEETTKAWPTLNSSKPNIDSDRDGMPDDWERKNKLNPNNSADASIATLHRFYTNIEVYINQLTK